MKISFYFTLISTVSLGIVYPLVLAGVALVMPTFFRPSLLNEPVQRDDLFQGRPSMSGGPYSGASNLSLTSPELAKQVDDRSKGFNKDAPGVWVPRDLLFASASGYDPDISVNGAIYQTARIAKARKMDEATLKQLVDQHTQFKILCFIGTDKINVIHLNESLEKLAPKIKPPVAP